MSGPPWQCREWTRNHLLMRVCSSSWWLPLKQYWGRFSGSLKMIVGLHPCAADFLTPWSPLCKWSTLGYDVQHLYQINKLYRKCRFKKRSSRFAFSSVVLSYNWINISKLLEYMLKSRHSLRPVTSLFFLNQQINADDAWPHTENIALDKDSVSFKPSAWHSIVITFFTPSTNETANFLKPILWCA